MKINRTIERSGNIPRYGNVVEGECFMFLDDEVIYMKTCDEDMIDLNTGEKHISVPDNEPVILVDAELSIRPKMGRYERFDTVVASDGCEIKTFYRSIHENKISIPIEIMKEMCLSNFDEIEIGICDGNIMIMKTENSVK